MKLWRTKLSLLSFIIMVSNVEAKPPTDEITQAQELVAAGDCVACHTAPGGRPYAGGLRMMTPLGAIYSTNITPDNNTGIGHYSYDDFAKAVRKGVAKDGRNLYPAMPYTSFSRINDQDMHRIYDYFMHHVTAVSQPNHPSDIPWPLNIRWPISLWNMMFHDDSPYQTNTQFSAEWNRGAYLVQGLAHCGTCHTPRGFAFQEKATDQQDKAYLTGGTLDGWHAPDLTSNMKQGLGRWTETEIVDFLKTGRTDKSAAFGSMTDVVSQSTQYLNDEDLHAIAVYLKSLPASDPQAPAPQQNDSTTQALLRGDFQQTGAEEYVDNCAACHRIDGQGYAKTFPALAHNSALLSDDPSSIISIILKGGSMAITKEAVTGLTMPDFGWRLNDQQVADVATFVRQSWGNQAPKVTPEQVKKLRSNLRSAVSEQKNEGNH